ncbi:hypothetical protein Cgig2_005368 [Carnegiea gigantea]|uniref:Uncharacterized protein ycf33 n=1 Tax=Carnegiea gigantea TaxID=171969 RepID=A0A9Q1K6M8_9CARY|nr:hypothetical protein Cgig2_005368 [Carnegiea gigantea]
MMKTCLMQSQLSQFLLSQAKITPKLCYLSHTCAYNTAPFPKKSRPSTRLKFKYMVTNEETTSVNHHHVQDSKEAKASNRKSEYLARSLVIAGAASVGVMMLLMMDKEAWALGPEGPLVEEFWENVRRYALYALTVSTGFIYTVVQPIFELLKNPISAVLVLIIIGGSIFIVSQILSAMVGVSDFSETLASRKRLPGIDETVIVGDPLEDVRIHQFMEMELPKMGVEGRSLCVDSGELLGGLTALALEIITSLSMPAFLLASFVADADANANAKPKCAVIK